MSVQTRSDAVCVEVAGPFASERTASPTRNLLRLRAEATERALRTWATVDLPGLNVAVLEGTATVADFVAATRPLIGALNELGPATLARLPIELARRILQLLGFIACSVEHHVQALGAEPGAGLDLLGGLEDGLAAAAIAAALPPTLGYGGYWTENVNDMPVTFTGDPQESYFRRMVVEVNDAQSEAAAALRPIARGQVPVASLEAVDRLREAADCEKRVHAAYASFRTRGAGGNENFSISFFTYKMRLFLVSFPVHGETFHGPNAANIAAQAALDYVSGIVEPFYVTHVQERMRYMTPNDRAQVISDMAAPSVLDRLLDELELTPEQIGAGALADRLRTRPELGLVLQAFAEFKRNAGSAAGAHWGLIVEYLRKGGEGASGHTMTVDPGHGTGGRSHADTEAVMRMRQREPVSTSLVSALRSLGGR
jgi:hypothetical protein